jgi:hypothetical protein
MKLGDRVRVVNPARGTYNGVGTITLFRFPDFISVKLEGSFYDEQNRTYFYHEDELKVASS